MPVYDLKLLVFSRELSGEAQVMGTNPLYLNQLITANCELRNFYNNIDRLSPIYAKLDVN